MAQKQNIDFNLLLPQTLRNETLDSLISNMFNRFVSEEDSVNLSGIVGNPVTGLSSIAAPTIERKYDALTPTIFAKSGTEVSTSTFDNLINKLDSLGVDIKNMKSWMQEQTYNYALPIDYDKFVNFSNYYWVGKLLNVYAQHSWNPSLDPEFNVIKRTKAGVETPAGLIVSLVENKKPSPLYASGRVPDAFSINFIRDAIISPENLDIGSSNDAAIFGVLSTTVAANPNETYVVTIYTRRADASARPLITFNINPGIVPFEAGDSISIFAQYFSGIVPTPEYYFANPTGKGTVTNIVIHNELDIIDGVHPAVGDTILVVPFFNPNYGFYTGPAGVYRVNSLADPWELLTGTVPNEYDKTAEGSAVFCENGDAYTSHTFLFKQMPQAGGDRRPNYRMIFIDDGIHQSSVSLNDWQYFNYWVHKDDLATSDFGPLNALNCIQATRPIIEYDDTLQLNSSINVVTRTPDDSAPLSYTQRKTKFNQLPQFDLFRYDGTHCGSTSSIFFYVEDNDFPLDAALKKKVKLNKNGDFVFGTGLVDGSQRNLYYKNSGQLTSLWVAGPSNNFYNNFKFTGNPNKGTISDLIISATANTQKWEITCISETGFSVKGTSSGTLSSYATINSLFVCDDMQFTIVPGTKPFVKGEKFSFNVISKIVPSYVHEDTNGVLVDKAGGALASDNGAWLTSERLFQNLARENKSEIAFGDILGHMSNVMSVQDGFAGVPFGNNNYRKLTADKGLGGNIHDFGSNFQLLISMLIQEDISPIMFIDFAERQYNVALGSIDQYLADNLAEFLTSHGIIYPTSTHNIFTDLGVVNAGDINIIELEDAFEQSRKSNALLQATFSDTTSGVTNWPATLPQLGFIPPVEPTIEFDNELGIEIIVHHDGHVAPVAVEDLDFNRRLISAVFPRTDSAPSPGFFSEGVPTDCFKNQLWMKNSTQEMYIFDVDFDDTYEPTVAGTGQLWFNRFNKRIYEWSNGTETVTGLDTETRRFINSRQTDVRALYIGALKQFFTIGTDADYSMFLSAAVSETGFGGFTGFTDDEVLATLQFVEDFVYALASDTAIGDSVYQYYENFVYVTRDLVAGYSNQTTGAVDIIISELKELLNPVTVVEATGINGWTLSQLTIQQCWKKIYTSNIRNSLLIAVENKLYNAIHIAQEFKLDAFLPRPAQYAVDLPASNRAASQFITDSEIELAKFALKYGFDTYAPNYVSSDPFTWNYSSAIIAPLSKTPARWFNVYKDYFKSFGAIPTSRPNIEPWKLLGIADKPADWDQYYASSGVTPSLNIVEARVVSAQNLETISGLQVIDGVQLANGDRVLLPNQNDPAQNGIYIARLSAWDVSQDIMLTNVTIGITEGFKFADTVWVMSSVPPVTIGTDAVIIEQVRMWSDTMWNEIRSARPDMKLCVNTATDQLLPPYVSPSLFASSEALLTRIPAGTSAEYSFGDDGPVELAWKKSTEYLYGMVRSLFRCKPLEILDTFWGYTYFNAGDSNSNLRVDRNILSSMKPVQFLSHGEKLLNQNILSPTDVAERINGIISSSVTKEVVFQVAVAQDNRTVIDVYVDGLYATWFYANTGIVGDNVTGPAPYTFNGVVFDRVSLKDRGIPFNLGDQIFVTISGTLSQYEHIPSLTNKFIGIGQWFANFLRYNFIDSESSKIIDFYKNWQVKMAYRFGAMINPETLNITTTHGILPETSYNVLLKKSSGTQSKWFSALRVQLLNMADNIVNGVGTPSTYLTKEGYYIPAGDASSWQFRIENYNPQHPIIEYYKLNAYGNYETFFALDSQSTELPWKKYTDVVGLETTVMPLTITGLQNVLNFIFGYMRRQIEIGFTLGNDQVSLVDPTTGRSINWQLEIEKLIDRVYSGMSAGDGQILNPSMDKIVLQTPVGLMAAFKEPKFGDVFSTQAAYDVIGGAIPVSNMNVIRTDERAIVYSTTPIFSAHIFLDEYEHAVIIEPNFSNESGSQVIFDAFLGAWPDKVYMNFTRNSQIDKKPTFSGFFLNGDNVSRNIVSSIDNISTYYDTTKSKY